MARPGSNSSSPLSLASKSRRAFEYSDACRRAAACCRCDSWRRHAEIHLVDIEAVQ